MPVSALTASTLCPLRPMACNMRSAETQSQSCSCSTAITLQGLTSHGLGEFLTTFWSTARATARPMHFALMLGTHKDPLYHPGPSERGFVILTLSLSDLTRAEFGEKAPKKTLLHPNHHSFAQTPEITLYGFIIIVVLGQIPPQVLYGGQVGLGSVSIESLGA